MKTRTRKPRTMKPRRMWANPHLDPDRKFMQLWTRKQYPHTGVTLPVLVIPLTREAVEELVRDYAKKSFGRHWAHPSHIEIARHVLSILGITAPRPAGEKDTTP